MTAYCYSEFSLELQGQRNLKNNIGEAVYVVLSLDCPFVSFKNKLHGVDYLETAVREDS